MASETNQQKSSPENLPPGTPERLRSQFEYYDKQATRHYRNYAGWKVVQLVAGGSIPLVAVLVPEPNEYLVRSLTAGLGALVAGSEAWVQLRQFNQNWIRWRATAEALRREAYFFYAKAGPYETAAKPEVLLANSVEDIVAMEQRSWRSLQDNPQAAKTGENQSTGNGT